MSDIVEILGKNIRNLRKEAGWTQEKLAEKAGISRNTLAKMGKNEYIALEMIGRICMKLELPIQDVLEVRCDDTASN